MPPRAEPVALVPERDVDVRGGRFFAASREPWLAARNLVAADYAGRFIEITYRLSFWDEPARPVFRFRQGEAFVDRIGAGPVAGRATWVGRVPHGTDRISVSPTNRAGPFDFEIEHVRRRAWPALLAQGLRWHPRPARSAILTRLIGWRPESDVNLAWAIGSVPMSGYATWQRSHSREAELAGLDRPRFAWATASPIRIVIVATRDDEALRRSVASLEAQIYPSWRAVVVGASIVSADPRISVRPLDQVADETAADPEGTLSGVLCPGDILQPAALAILAERAHASSGSTLVYGDEAQRLGDASIRPILKPGWSPRLQAAHPYLGRAVFVRDVRFWPSAARRDFLGTGTVPVHAVRSLEADTIMPLRRILVETSEVPAPPPPPPEMPPNLAARAAIIVPTKDHPALLRRLVASIRARSPAGRYQIVVVDNASTDPETAACLDTLRRDADALVLDHPGPFNFSQICNEAAAVADADVLVFLNDDMEVVSDDWLDRLVAHAMRPDVGAVGARLTYPDGRLQHVGVLVGMGESAGHFGALAPGDDPGWAGRNTAVHEVSAVTGACLAVSRAKFEAVGGFDAEHLPIELSDIDLCLKLNARGWQTILDPSVHLMHEESASRGGATLRRLTVHDQERAIFVERWRHVLRDDPFFHPGLSLYRWQAALA